MNTCDCRTLGISPEALGYLDPEDFRILAKLLEKIERRRRAIVDDALSSLADNCKPPANESHRDSRSGYAQLEPATDCDVPLALPQASNAVDHHRVANESNGPRPHNDSPHARDCQHQTSGMGARLNSADDGSQAEKDALHTNNKGPHSTTETPSPRTQLPSARSAGKPEATKHKLLVHECVSNSGIVLDVSIEWLSKKAAALKLTKDELEELLAIRRDFDAGLREMMHRLAGGLSTANLYQLHHIRHEVESYFDGASFSIKAINAFCDAFPVVSLGNEDTEGVAEVIVHTFRRMCEGMPQLRSHPNRALHMMVKAATTYHRNDVDACLRLWQSLIN